jgi:hypothetical protein
VTPDSDEIVVGFSYRGQHALLERILMDSGFTFWRRKRPRDASWLDARELSP